MPSLFPEYDCSHTPHRATLTARERAAQFGPQALSLPDGKCCWVQPAEMPASPN